MDSQGGTEASTYDADNYLTTRTYEGQGQEMRVEFVNNKEGWNTTLTRYSDLAGTSLVATSEFGYDDAGRVTRIISKDAGSTILNQFDYTYTSGGNLASKTETQNGAAMSLTYGYDDASQMTAEGTTGYAYDATGNRTGGGNVVAAGNRLTSDGLWDYTYDDNGNVVKKSQGPTAETWIYGYSPNNRLVLVQKWTEDPTFPGTAILQLEIEYKYDVFGNRIEKSVDDDGLSGDPAVTTGFAYDGWNPNKPAPIGRENFDVLMHVDGNSSLTTRYEYTDRVDQQLGRIDVTGTTDTYWTLGDYQNSVRDVIDNAGVVKDSIRYDGYGNIVAETDSAFRGWYGWTGREFEIETELQYNHANWYDPKTGRWLTQDPLGFDAGDSNLYRYVMNRPTFATDPSGLIPYRDDAITLKEFVDFVTEIETNMAAKNGGNAPAPLDVLKQLTQELSSTKVSKSGSGSGSRFPAHRKMGDSGWNYIFTTKGGWIDLPHFSYAAYQAALSEIFLERPASRSVET